MAPPSRQFALKDASRRWWLVLVALLLGSVYLYVSPQAPKQHVFEGRTMGTTYRVVLGDEFDVPVVTELQRQVEALLVQVNRTMSTYDPTSELSRFNQHESTQPVDVSPELAKVVAMAQEVSQRSNGLFDVTVGPLVNAWGFGPEGRPQRALAEQELAELRQRVGFENLLLQGSTLAKVHPKLQVDLSAIAKGYGVDEVALLLERQGIANYLVDIGGEVRARGRNLGGAIFRVGIEEPNAERRSVRLAITLHNESLATSGNYRNYFELEGTRYVHTLDPTTGKPVQHNLLSASVVHKDCAMADGWATALMAAGPEKAWELVQANGLHALLLISDRDGAVLERASPEFAQRRVGPQPQN